jgi:hypothetical protein
MLLSNMYCRSGNIATPSMFLTQPATERKATSEPSPDRTIDCSEVPTATKSPSGTSQERMSAHPEGNSASVPPFDLFDNNLALRDGRGLSILNTPLTMPPQAHSTPPPADRKPLPAALLQEDSSRRKPNIEAYAQVNAHRPDQHDQPVFQEPYLWAVSATPGTWNFPLVSKPVTSDHVGQLSPRSMGSSTVPIPTLPGRTSCNFVSARDYNPAPASCQQPMMAGRPCVTVFSQGQAQEPPQGQHQGQPQPQIQIDPRYATVQRLTTDYFAAHWAVLLVKRLPAGRQSIPPEQYFFDEMNPAFGLALRFWIQQLCERGETLGWANAFSTDFMNTHRPLMAGPHGGPFWRVHTQDGQLHIVMLETGYATTATGLSLTTVS